MKAFLFASAGLCVLASTPAQALNSRTWVSGKGNDTAGCGPIATPCRTLQFGHDQTSPGGEVDVLDSAGYGSLIINRAITIIGDGSIAGVLAPAGGVAIDINAGASDTVVLRGLTIEGQGSGINGIRLNAGGRITVANCVVQNFVGNGPTDGIGILFQPSSGATTIVISDTTASYNGYSGIALRPTGSGAANAQISRAVVNNTKFAVAINASNTTGETTATITDSLATSSSAGGFIAQGATAKMMVERSTAIGNNTGFQSSSGAVVYVGGSTAAGNVFGFAGNSTVFSYGNNQVDLNAVDGTASPVVLR